MQRDSSAGSLSTGAAERAVLRHLVATLAYRASKVLRDVPDGFGATVFGNVTRRPVLVVAHMADLIAWAITMTRGETKWKAAGSQNWDVEVRRFFDGLATFDAALAGDGLPAGSIEQLIQGPLADALTHVGQLAMLRGMAGAPVKPESYAKAQVVAGRVGLAQAAPGREFEGDASVPR